MAVKKLAAGTAEVLDYLKQFDNGEGCSIEEIANALNRSMKSILPTVTLSLAKKKDGSREALAVYEKRTVEGKEKPVGYAVLTDAGRVYTDPVEAE